MKIAFLMTILSAMAISSTSIGAGHDNQQFRFRIPSAQELMHSDDSYAQELEQRYALVWSISAEELREYSFRRCPLFSKLVFKISENIIDANKLRTFFQADSPVFKTEAGCFKVLRGGNGPEAGYGGVKLPASLAISSASEDELAFVIAHEMSHIILQHYRAEPDYRKNKLTAEIWSNQQGEGSQTEKEADGLGTILMANAGYDPRAAGDSFCNTIRYLKDYPAYSPCFAISLVSDPSHGSNRKRFNRVADILKEIGYGKSPGRTRSNDLLEARKESIATAKMLLSEKKSGK